MKCNKRQWPECEYRKISYNLSIKLQSAECITPFYSSGADRQTQTHTPFTLTCQFLTYLVGIMFCLPGARAHVILPVAGRRFLIGAAFRQSYEYDPSVLEYLRSLLVACGTPVESLHGATASDVTGS